MKGGKIVVRQDFGTLKFCLYLGTALLPQVTNVSTVWCLYHLFQIKWIQIIFTGAYCSKSKIKINIVLKFKGHTLRQLNQLNKISDKIFFLSNILWV